MVGVGVGDPPLSQRPVVHRPKCIPSPLPPKCHRPRRGNTLAEREKVLPCGDVIGRDLRQMAEEIYWSRASAQDGAAISLRSRQEKPGEAAGSVANLNFQMWMLSLERSQQCAEFTMAVSSSSQGMRHKSMFPLFCLLLYSIPIAFLFTLRGM